MQLTLKVTPTEGEPYEVKTNLFVIVAWERRFKTKASTLSTTGVGLEDLAFMAYESCKQMNISVSPSFDDFVKKLANIEVVEEEQVNPTDGEHTAEV
jgi:hypothetical protein